MVGEQLPAPAAPLPAGCPPCTMAMRGPLSLPFTSAFLRWALWPEIAALEKCAELEALDTAPRPPLPMLWEPGSPSAQGGLLFLVALLRIKAGNGQALIPPLQLWSGGASRVLSKWGAESEGCSPTLRLLEPQIKITSRSPRLTSCLSCEDPQARPSQVWGRGVTGHPMAPRRCWWTGGVLGRCVEGLVHLLTMQVVEEAGSSLSKAGGSWWAPYWWFWRSQAGRWPLF